MEINLPVLINGILDGANNVGEAEDQIAALMDSFPTLALIRALALEAWARRQISSYGNSPKAIPNEI